VSLYPGLRLFLCRCTWSEVKDLDISLVPLSSNYWKREYGTWNSFISVPVRARCWEMYTLNVASIDHAISRGWETVRPTLSLSLSLSSVLSHAVQNLRKAGSPSLLIRMADVGAGYSEPSITPNRHDIGAQVGIT
jgi:hypothetical protein